MDGQWRRESSDHAYWLDELFPEKPLCPAEHKEKIEEIDRWVSDTYLTSNYRRAIDGGVDIQYLRRAWRLAALVSADTPLPWPVRLIWPVGLRVSPFIQEMGKHMDLTETYDDMRARILSELIEYIGDGPYMGGLDQPTMLDFAVFPQLIFAYMFGLEDTLSAATHPEIKSWLKRVSEHLPKNPTLAADKMQVNSLADALAVHAHEQLP